MTDHFISRAMERIGLARDAAELLAAELRRAIAARDERFVHLWTRARGGAEVWRFRLGDGWFYAVTEGGQLMTVLTPGQTIARKSNSKRSRRALRDMPREVTNEQ